MTVSSSGCYLPNWKQTVRKSFCKELNNLFDFSDFRIKLSAEKIINIHMERGVLFLTSIAVHVDLMSTI